MWVGHTIIYLKYFFLVSKRLFAPPPHPWPISKSFSLNLLTFFQLHCFHPGKAILISQNQKKPPSWSTSLLLSSYKPFSPTCQRGLFISKSDCVSPLFRPQWFLLSSIKSKLLAMAHFDLNIAPTCLYNLIPFFPPLVHFVFFLFFPCARLIFASGSFHGEPLSSRDDHGCYLLIMAAWAQMLSLWRSFWLPNINWPPQ